MADTEKTHDLSEDPEKVPDLSHQPTYHDGEIKVVTELKHADPNDGDEALKAFVGHEGETIVMTPEMEKKLLRKIDLNLMPVRLIVSKLSFAKCPPGLANTWFADAMRCVWPQLFRQDHSLVCQYNGSADIAPSQGDQLSMARKHVLYWLYFLGIPHQSTPPATTSSEIFLFQHHYVGLDTLLHGCYQELCGCGCSQVLPWSL